jgi:pyroglutamyl-peptidase
MTIIITGFQPFGGRSVNRSWQVVERVALGDGAQRVQLPVAFARLARAVPELAGRADVLLLVGESGQATTLRIETRARNAVTAELADNDGARPLGALDIGAPDELATTWDVERALAAARAVGVAAEPSNDAGGYCCNAALFHALRAARPRAIVGFVHVPVVEAPPAPSTDDIARAIEAIVATMTR